MIKRGPAFCGVLLNNKGGKCNCSWTCLVGHDRKVLSLFLTPTTTTLKNHSWSESRIKYGFSKNFSWDLFCVACRRARLFIHYFSWLRWVEFVNFLKHFIRKGGIYPFELKVELKGYNKRYSQLKFSETIRRKLKQTQIMIKECATSIYHSSNTNHLWPRSSPQDMYLRFVHWSK